MTVLLYLVFGVFAGILAGLLGVGGGIVVVPILNFTLPLEGVNPSVIHHMAIATSLASIVFTSISSARSHNKRGTVRWDIAKTIGPGLFLSTFAGTFVVSGIPTRPLKIVFIIFLAYTATQMLLNLKSRVSFRLPGVLGLLPVGLVIGFIASFIGIGGGALIMPFLLMCNVPMLSAISTSAALCFPIALGGSLGFILNGWGHAALPAFSLGFIYLPALAGLVVASMLCAPLGVRLSHSLPVHTLKRCFGCMFLLVAARMIYSLL